MQTHTDGKHKIVKNKPTVSRVSQRGHYQLSLCLPPVPQRAQTP